MDIDRARSIIKADGKIDVLYKQSPVWLESVRSNNMVDITILENGIKETVPVTDLTEIQ